MKTRPLFPLLLAVAVLLSTAFATSPQSGKSSGKSDGPKNKAASGRGAELFAIHCNRCHKPPDDLSPRIVPAVMAHMRNRAMLSQKDEQEILKFLTPQ